MPLQNRVAPSGELFADAVRGTLMGNRGGRMHDGDRALSARRWVSRQWICCRLDFKDRRRKIWGDGYTELFFLDEVTALAAGHRPCFECRRADALAFAAHWEKAFGKRPRASEMDKVLHAERLDGGEKRIHAAAIDGLADGVVVRCRGEPWAVKGDRLLRWLPDGYGDRAMRPENIRVEMLTPPSIAAVLASGYRPRWHASAIHTAKSQDRT